MVDRAEALLLKARTNMERFGMAIMVIAAVAPLLGLLGTVSGMISTFAIITEHGTGDPKLLSGGISEALITTQLGLMVAIPLLLLGNLLNGWCGRISANLEEKVLMRIANYKPQSAPPPTKSNQDKQYA
jgi:biopolymer transport protein ExbB